MEEPHPLVAPGQLLVVSAGGPITDEFLLAARISNTLSCLADEKHPRAVAKSICLAKPAGIVILGTRRSEEDSDSRLRFMGANSSCPRGVQALEPGNLVTGFVAALLERALLDSIPARCFLAPRASVLEMQTGLSLAKVLLLENVFGSQQAPPLYSSLMRSTEWIMRALDEDERRCKRQEPEGFFT